MSTDASANSPAAQKRRQVRHPKTGRKKTSIACQHCWKSKTRCGVKRPCDRCIRLGHKDCHDRPEATRKRQHTNKTNKAKLVNNINSKRVASNSTHIYSNSNSNSGYLASTDVSNSLPPIVPVAAPIIPTSLPLISNILIPTQYLVNSNMNHHTINQNLSMNMNNINLFRPTLDPNYNMNGKSKSISAPNCNISRLLIGHGGGNVMRNNNDKNYKKAGKKSKKSKKIRNKKKDKKRVRSGGGNKKRKHMSNKHNINHGKQPPFKKRRLTQNFGDVVDGNAADCEGEIIYWDSKHREIDPFSDSSHYSTEYLDDDINDPSPAVIISIQKDNKKHQQQKKKETEVWSHYTFTRGSLSKFVSVDTDTIKNKNTNHKKYKRSRIPLKKMTLSQKKCIKKRDRGVEEDLAAILGPIGMVKFMNKKKKNSKSDTQIETQNNININSNNNNKIISSISLPNVDHVNINTNTNNYNVNSHSHMLLYKQIPTHNPIFNYNYNRVNTNGVLSQMIPNFSLPMPAIPIASTNMNNINAQMGMHGFNAFQLNNGNPMNAFNIQNISNNLSILSNNLNVPQSTPPTMTRISSLIPAPTTTK